MRKKDKTGKVSGFLWSQDDADVADFYASSQPTEPFGHRVFVSFERSSLELAKKFEAAFREFGLEPYRYAPVEEIRARQTPYTLREIKTNYPETFRGLAATLRRSAAIVFIVSEPSLKSPLCEMEGFLASIIHSFWPQGRVRNEAGIYLILEKPELVPPWLRQYWSRVYEEGLEYTLAELLASEIERLSNILQLVEEHRSRIYR